MNKLTVLENNNERVLTTKQLAEVYETNEETIRKDFSNNKSRFIDGIHYYKLTGEELKDFKDLVNDIHVVDKRTPTLILWTEKGASRMCKILDTDRAWKRFDELEECYFRVKDNSNNLIGMLYQMSNKIDYLTEKVNRIELSAQTKRKVIKKPVVFEISNSDIEDIKEVIDLAISTGTIRNDKNGKVIDMNVLNKILHDHNINKRFFNEIAPTIYSNIILSKVFNIEGKSKRCMYISNK